MSKSMEYAKAVMAGAMIGIGDAALVIVENKYIAAVLFAVALLSIIELKLPLYTGRIGKVLKNKNYADCLLYLCCNAVGCASICLLLPAANETFFKNVPNTAAAKYGKSFAAMFVAGILCNVLIHIAVSAKRELITVLCVAGFILCGFEHSIADVGFLLFAPNLGIALLKWVLVLLGNTVGGIVTELLIAGRK